MTGMGKEASFTDFEKQLDAKDARIKELEAQLSNSAKLGSAQHLEMPLLPLPLQYPANLIFAQNMVAISLSQLQRVDLTTAQLRFHLREHELRAATAALLNSQAGLGFSAAQVVAAQCISEPAAEAVAAAAAGVEADAAAPAAAAEGGGAAAPLEHLWAHRRRLAAAVKIAFVMILLEVRTGWFFVYFFAVFLYIGGIFDPIIDWFQRRPVRVTLEQQLTALRNRQRNPPAQPPQTQPGATVAAGGSGTTDGANASAASSGSGEAAVGGSSSSADPSSVDASAASSSDRAGASGALSEPTNEAGGADAAAVAAPPQLPYWHRFTYQLVVMFFMTLLPWWNPDPRYL